MISFQYRTTLQKKCKSTPQTPPKRRHPEPAVIIIDSNDEGISSPSPLRRRTASRPEQERPTPPSKEKSSVITERLHIDIKQDFFQKRKEPFTAAAAAGRLDTTAARIASSPKARRTSSQTSSSPFPHSTPCLFRR